jgi:tRNA (guanine-N7-)-methyltransferase
LLFAGQKYTFQRLSLPLMAQKKLLRFTEIKTYPHVFEYPKDMKGKWQEFFKNGHPIILELACGRGEYTVGLAKMYAEKNFIGVDIKGNRMYIGAKRTLQEKMSNTAFLRTKIEMLADYFEPGEVDEIWITFPDPQLRISKAKKRLTHPRFLRSYQQILKPGGLIHLKTDSPVLFAFTKLVIDMYQLKIVEECNDVHGSGIVKPELQIITHYESLDIAESKKVYYLQFTLPGEIKMIDDQLQKLLKDEEQVD